MTTLHPAMVLETGRAAIAARIVRKERVETGATLRNMALFLAAPFVGLAYAVLLPFVGLGMLLVYAARTFYTTGRAHEALRIARKMLLWVVTPLAGLAYFLVLPFAGLATLAWFGAKALMAPA